MNWQTKEKERLKALLVANARKEDVLEISIAVDRIFELGVRNAKEEAE